MNVLNIVYLAAMKYICLFCFIALAGLACKKKSDPPKGDPAEDLIEIKTDFGTMYLWLYKETPLHRQNFLKLATEGFFDGTTFHRIVPAFVIQGGDPNTKDADSTNDGSGGPGYTIPAEINDTIKHVYGAVGAARNNNPQKASNGSQFYIVVDPNGEPGLNKNYTVFGRIISGMDVATTIVGQPRNLVSPKDRPYSDIKMDVNVVKKTKAQLKAEFGFTPSDFE